MADTRLGVFSKFYVNTGTYGSPTWLEVDLISNLTINAAFDKGESSARRARVKTNEPTMLDLNLTGQVRVDNTDNGYNEIRDAFLAADTVDVLVLNGANTRNGSLGFRFDAKVFSLGEDQSLGSVLFNDIEIGPCASDNDPKSVEVTAGVPVFSDIAVPPT